MRNALELVGTIAGIIGAFLVALKYGHIGYPFFMLSSIALLCSAICKRQNNFIALQSVFLTANIIGLIVH